MIEEIKVETQTTTQTPQIKLVSPKQILLNIDGAVKWLKCGNYKDSDARWNQWELNKKYMMCVWPDSDTTACTNVNTIFSNYHTVLPTLYFKNPEVTAEPTQPDFKRTEMGDLVVDEMGNPVLIDNYKAAKLLSIKINYELRELKFKKQIKKVIGNCLAPYGIGWMKIGYSQIAGIGGLNNEKSRSYSFWMRRADPRNIVYDWMATDIESCRFIAERNVLTREDALNQGFKIPDDYVSSLPDFLQTRNKKTNSNGSTTEVKDDDLIIVWEYHDLQHDVLYWTLDKQVSETTIDEDSYIKDPVYEPYPFEGSALVPLVLNEDDDDLIGLSDIEPVEDQALAINKGRTKQTQHVEHYGTKTIYEDGSIKDHELEKDRITPHGVYLKTEAGAVSSGRIVTVGTTPMGQDNYNMDALHKEDMRTTLGITDYQQGGAGSRRATEATIITNSSNVRIDERRDGIYDFVIECVRKLSALIQQFAKDEDFVNIADLDLKEDFVDYLKSEHGFNPKIPFLKMRKQDIQGEYNFKFRIDDMIMRPKEVQVQQMIQTFGVISQNQGLMDALKEEGYSWKQILDKIFELQGIDGEELKESGPVKLSPVKENLMFVDGKEVPEPHRKDEHPEHIYIHQRAVDDISKEIHPLKQKSQQIQQQMMKIQQQAAQATADPVNGPVIIQQAQGQIAEFQDQLKQLSEQMRPSLEKLRKLRIHLQHHTEMEQRKNAQPQNMGGGGGVMPPIGQAAPNPNARKQVAINAQAGRAA